MCRNAPERMDCPRHSSLPSGTRFMNPCSLPFSSGQMLESLSVAMICLLSKGRDRREIRRWRPITLLDNMQNPCQDDQCSSSATPPGPDSRRRQASSRIAAFWTMSSHSPRQQSEHSRVDSTWRSLFSTSRRFMTELTGHSLRALSRDLAFH